MKRNNTWVAWALAVAMIGYLVGSATVSRSAVVPGFNYSSYATGTALHADLIQAASTGPRVVGADLAYSASNTNSAGFAATSTVGELNLNLQPSNVPFAAKKASARGAGLELGVGSSLPADAGDVLQLAGEAGQAAPPNAATANVTDLGPIALPPVAYASLLHSEARAVDAPLNPCLSTPSSPLSMARGYAADAQLLNTGADLPDDRFAAPVVATDDPNPERSVTQSWSYTYAVPNNFSDSNGLHYGLVTEIHQTYAPVTIIRDAVAGGTLIIEVLGEWVFKTVATGLPGGSQIFYNVIDPATGQQVPKTTPILRI
ncbi:MAG: hypothetical protein QOF21_91, partial [Actinomycetota bacterium]